MADGGYRFPVKRPLGERIQQPRWYSALPKHQFHGAKLVRTLYPVLIRQWKGFADDGEYSEDLTHSYMQRSLFCEALDGENPGWEET